METYITIGEIIKHYRKEKGMSQEMLSQGICDRKYISNVENNKNIPTLDIINQLSDKLEINLYDTYALMLRHHDIDTHKKIENLNSCFNKERAHLLAPMIEEYESLIGFQHGEPAQYLKYAKGLYNANILNNYHSAISLFLEALSLNNNFTISMPINSKHLSNIELSLIHALAINYCRIDELCLGEKYLHFLHTYSTNFLSQNHYLVNKNNQFELKFMVNVTYNYFLFFRENSSINLDFLNNTIHHLHNYHCNYKLPELLLCQSYIHCKSNNIINAKKLWRLSNMLGNYLYEVNYQKHLEKIILAECYNIITSEL